MPTARVVSDTSIAMSWGDAQQRAKPPDRETGDVMSRNKPVEIVNLDALDRLLLNILGDVRTEGMSRWFVTRSRRHIRSRPQLLRRFAPQHASIGTWPAWVHEKLAAQETLYRYPAHPEFTDGNTELHERLRRLARWIKALEHVHDAALEKINPRFQFCSDDQHRAEMELKSLLKRPTLEDAEMAAVRWYGGLKKRLEIYEEDWNTKDHYRFDDGWRVVRLMTVQSLEREGRMMRHCLGDGGYDACLSSGPFQFYSLRDPKNRPHVTLSLVGNRLSEMNGFANNPVTGRHRLRVAMFLNACEVQAPESPEVMFRSSMDHNGRAYIVLQ